MAKSRVPERTTREQAQLDAALARFRDPIKAELRQALDRVAGDPDLATFYGQMAYHLGWVNDRFAPVPHDSGKLLRPALLLWANELACQVAGVDGAATTAREHQARAAAVAVELVHNFSLIHDDIEDRDELRHHRPTLWTIWGEGQGINTGDGMFCLARIMLWETVTRGYAPDRAVKLAELFDRTCLLLCEGQHLDMTNEAVAQVAPDAYIKMIGRKTAALMRCATEMGGRIGYPESHATAAALADFGEALGVAFQMRDDLLGIWADTAQLGKTAAGDIRRKKMSLPVIHALAHAPADDRSALRAIYAAPGPATDVEIPVALAILDRTSRAWCQAQLVAQCEQALAALARSYGAHAELADSAAAQALGALVRYVEIAGRP